MLSVTRTDKGFQISVEYNGRSLHFKEWDATDACIYYFPLATLADNGMATYDIHGCFVPFDSLYWLDEQDRELLGLPPLYPYAMRLRSIGDFKSPDFHYAIDYMSHVPDGDLFNLSRYGNVVVSNSGKSYLLTELQYELVKLVEKFNDTPAEYSTFEHTLRKFAEIKKAAREAEVILDSFLDGEDVYAPKEIRLELSREGDSMVILPSVDIDQKEKFKKTFDRQRRVLDVYPISNDEGNRTRVVLDKDQRSQLKPIKEHRCRYSNLEEILDIIDHPTEYFDPDFFDLSEFYSERVIDLGFYNPKFTPFISPYKSEWLAGARVEHPVDGTTNITIDTQEKLQELNDAIISARESGSNLCRYRETEIGIEDAQFLAKVAERQLANPETPVNFGKDEKGRKVLIIEENTDKTGYSLVSSTIEKEKEYILYRNPNLKPEFSLKTHQEEGIAWLQYLYGINAPGCLMADDMGLGKTLQLLYFIDWHARTHPDHKPYLIVAPVSLIENWQNEYLRFFSKPMRISVLSSSQVPRKFDREAIRRMEQCKLIITNYETVRNCQLNFAAVDFDVVVLDEAQKVKTPGTLVTTAVKALKSGFRVAMTGTPVENTLIDLWCVMDFCVPGLLGNAKDFTRKYQSPLHSADTDVMALGEEVHRSLGAFFMRRLKKDAAKDLPVKHEIRKEVNMPAVQTKTYRRVTSLYDPGKPGDMIHTILKLRQVSEHPYLYEHTLDLHECESLVEHAARLIATIGFIDQIRQKGEKVIIFAEYKEIQKMLHRVIRNRYRYTAKIINGDTPTHSSPNFGKQSRQAAIDEFQSQDGFGVIIMSPVAAGMGLNVTAANHVIHYSRLWNPAKENQATDRAYRIGQEKDVYVYYPMAVNPDFKSFDVTLDELLQRKIDLASSAIFPTDRIEVRSEEFQQLFNIG